MHFQNFRVTGVLSVSFWYSFGVARDRYIEKPEKRYRNPIMEKRPHTVLKIAKSLTIIRLLTTTQKANFTAHEKTILSKARRWDESF